MSFTDQRGLVIIFSNQADTDDSPPSSPPSYSPTSPSLPSHSPGLATSHSPTTANHSHPPTTQPPPPPQPASPLPQVACSTILTFCQMVDVGKDNEARSHISSSLLVPPLEGAHTTDTLGEITFLRLDHNMASGFPSKINISRPALLAGGRLNLCRKLPACPADSTSLDYEHL